MKTEKPTKTRKVQLIPIIANVQKLISPSPKIKVQLKAEAEGAEFLQKQLCHCILVRSCKKSGISIQFHLGSSGRGFLAQAAGRPAP